MTCNHGGRFVCMPHSAHSRATADCMFMRYDKWKTVQYRFRVRRLKQETLAYITYRRYCFQSEAGQKSAVTDFHYPAVFPPEFSVLPQKIFANLRADSLSDANSREIRALRNILNIKGLHLRKIFRPYKMHRFSMRLSTYQGLKHTISRPDIVETGGWNRHKRSAESTGRHSTTECTTRQYGRNRP